MVTKEHYRVVAVPAFDARPHSKTFKTMEAANNYYSSIVAGGFMHAVLLMNEYGVLLQSHTTRKVAVLAGWA